jgi:Bacterial protein of unknown function (DUF916)
MTLMGLVIGLTLIVSAGGSGSAFAVGSTTSTTSGTSSAPKVRKNVAVFGTQTSGPDKPDGRGFFDFAATPGGDIEDHVAVFNYSLQPLTLEIGAADALNTPQGGFALLPPTQRSKDIGTWIAFQKPDLNLKIPARSSVIIPFLVGVPKNATPGDHIGGITATLQSFVTGKSGQRIRLLQSVGTRVFVRVSGPLRPALTVTNLAVKYHDPLNPIGTGTGTLTYTVSNVGNVALGGRPIAYISGLLGSKSTAAHLPEIQLLLPGNSVKETAKVTGVYPEVHETAHVSITRLIVPGSVQPASGPFKASVSFWAIPWIVLAILVIILGGAIWWFVRRRRRGPEGDVASKKDAGATAPKDVPVARDATPANGSGSGNESVIPEPAEVDHEIATTQEIDK